MDHSNQATNAHSHQKCAHGRCLNHDPEWKNVGEKRHVPAPSFFGLKTTFWSEFCCGAPMSRCNTVQDCECQKCGRRVGKVITEKVAVCLCCGYHYEVRPPGPLQGM